MCVSPLLSRPLAKPFAQYTALVEGGASSLPHASLWLNFLSVSRSELVISGLDSAIHRLRKKLPAKQVDARAPARSRASSTRFCPRRTRSHSCIHQLAQAHVAGLAMASRKGRIKRGGNGREPLAAGEAWSGVHGRRTKREKTSWSKRDASDTPPSRRPIWNRPSPITASSWD